MTSDAGAASHARKGMGLLLALFFFFGCGYDLLQNRASDPLAPVDLEEQAGLGVGPFRRAQRTAPPPQPVRADKDGALHPPASQAARMSAAFGCHSDGPLMPTMHSQQR